VLGAAVALPVHRRLLHGAGGLQRQQPLVDRPAQRRPGGQQRLVGDADGVHAVGGVDHQQAAVDEHLRRGPDPLRQSRDLHPPSRPASDVIDRDQAHQSGEHVVLGQPRRRHGGHQRVVGVPGQRPLHPAEGRVPRHRERVAAAEAVGQLPQREGQQRQRVAAAGVVDQARRQLRLEPQPGHPRRSHYHRGEQVAAQRGQHEGVDRCAAELGQVAQVVEELRAQGQHGLHGAPGGLAQQGGDERALRRIGPGEQLLALVDGHQ
jgi:hypothetical protein